MSRGVLLDTHSWVWLVEGSERLGEEARRKIEAAAAGGGVGVSPISVWEIGMLEARGRLSFRRDPAAWIDAATAAPGIEIVPVSPRVAWSASRLPGDFHGDPADRILVATARETGRTLVTADARILDYAQAGHVRAADAAL